jgi:HTH-type transcriptional regulator/antitoxin HipB
MDAFLAKTPAQLGAILRGFRKQRGLTQQAVADRLGLRQKVISLAETHPDRLSLARLFQLLSALGVELALQDQDAPRARSDW